jgi:SAM-dependent methyltransferase
MADTEYRDASRDQWGGAAEHWAEAAEKPDTGASARAAEWMLDAAALRPGERVLEVACGAGRVGLQAAEIVGADGVVVCSDFAEPMVEIVRGRIERLGLSNVEARALDAEQMSFDESDRFDAVLCRMGYMLMSDPLAALTRSREALRPGGRLALAVWGSAEENPWLGEIFEAVMAHLGAPPPEEGTPGPFALPDPERLARLLEEAGFDRIATERLEAEQSYDSLAAWWDEILGLGGPLATLLESMPEGDVQSIRGAALESGKKHESGDGTVRFPATMITALVAEALQSGESPSAAR